MISLVKKYLELTQFSEHKESFEDLFLSHPNYPSVYAVTDSLDGLSVENIAIKVPKEQLQELPNSFLALFNDDFVLVYRTEASIKIETDKGEKKNLTFNEFLSGWNGVILAIEPNTNKILKNEKSNTKWFSYTSPVILLIILSVAFNHYSFTNMVLLATSLIGLVISIFIVQEKLGYKNEIASRFCSINPKASCDSVIKSSKSDINKWVGFSDLPLIFFGVNTLSILLQPENSAVIVGFLSLVSVPVIIYSIWLQQFELKKWCVLCLAVSFVLLLQGFVFGVTQNTFPDLAAANLVAYAFSLLLLTPGWLLVKPVLENKMKAEKAVTQAKKFKRNFGLFNFLSKEIPASDGFDQLEGLRFGGKNAEINLTIIISPSCGHCHKAFEDAFELHSKFPERVSLNVLFNINPENNDNQYKIVVESLLTISNVSPELAVEAICDWHIRKIGLDKWKDKWVVTVVDMKTNHQIYLQYNWCMENGFNYTPVKITNGKLFPDAYEISELKYFLNDFSQEKEETGSNVLVQA